MPVLDDMSLDELQSLRVQRLTLDGFPGAQITSDRRTPQHNAEVGGVPNSQHLSGTAIDFAGANVSPDAARQYYASHGVNLTESLNEGDHMHVAWGPKGGAQPAAQSLDDMSLDQLRALRQQTVAAQPKRPPPMKTPTGNAAASITPPAPPPKLTKAQIDAKAAGDRSDKARGSMDPTGGQSRALMDSYTFGFGDEIQGGLAAAKAGLKNLVGMGPGYTAGQAYDATTADARARLAAFKQQHPGQAMGLGLAGAILNPTNVVGGEFVRGAQGGQAVARAAVAGGAIGATSGAGAGTDAQSRLKGAAIGGAVGAGTGAALEGTGQALAARSAARAANPSAARQLSQAGVQLTPGQMMGGIPKRVEDAATSLPFTGAAINGARRRGLQTFNRAAINESLAPIGVQLQGNVNMARDSVRLAEQAISDSYTQALAPVQGLIPDQQYAAEVAHIAQTPNLPADVQAELTTTLNDVQGQWTTPIDGQQWKRIDSQLGRAAQAADNASGTRPSMARLADALRAVRTAHQGVLDRASPQAMAAVRNSDLASANFARVRQASQYVGTAARDGVFTPADLNRAVQGLDNSANNRAYARGDALGQQLSQAGQTVLPSSIPDSGTALRGMLGLGAYGGTAGMFGGGVALKAAIADLTASGLYTPPVQAAVNAIYRATTPGQASGALAQLARLAARNPGLAPLYNELRAQISGQGSAPAKSIPMKAQATLP